MITTAFVLGAGLGTRLRALTARRPKPLIPVCNRPLITYAFDHLLGLGAERLIVNTHHRAEAYAAAFPERAYRRVPITFQHEPEILETAGGIKNVEALLGVKSFVVYNGDILSDLPLAPALRTHEERGDEVTLVLRSRDGPLEVTWDRASGRVTAIGGIPGPQDSARFLFTGIYFVRPEFLARVPRQTKVGVIPIFREMIRTGAKLGGVCVDAGEWWDLGTREKYLEVHRRLAETTGRERAWIDPAATVAGSAQLRGACAIGPRAVIGAGARLENCLVWEGAEIAEGSFLRECIVTDGQRVSGAHAQVDF